MTKKVDRRYPTRETLKVFRDQGLFVAEVEYYDHKARRRFDMFGFIDILVLTENGEMLAIQATSRSNIAARVKKITGPCREQALSWLWSGGAIEVWGWDKFDDEYRVKKVEITEEDLQGE